VAELVTLAERARRAERGRRAAMARSLSRRAMGPLFWKYLDVVPAVFSASGDLLAFSLIAPRVDVLARLRPIAVLTLDSATETLAGFRFGKARNDYAYFSSTEEALAIEKEGLGLRRETSFPFAWTPPDREMLFAVVPAAPLPSREVDGHRVVTTERLLRDLIGFYGLRGDLVALIEARLGR